MNTTNIIVTSIMQENYFQNLTDDAKRTLLNLDIFSKSQEAGCRILVFNSQCEVISDSNAVENGNTLLLSEVITAFEKKNAYGIHKQEKAIYVSASIRNELGEVLGAILLVSSINDIFETITSIRQTLWMYTMITICVVIILVFVVSHLLLVPLRKILVVLEKMSNGQLDQRIHISSHDEYETLANSFNTMADKLGQVEKNRDEFVSNVSHELKTPLSSIKVLSESITLQENVPENMYREFLFDILSEVDRMTNIVNDLLELVKIDHHEMTMHVEPTNMQLLMEKIIKRLTPLAEQKKIIILYEHTKEVLIDADQMRLNLAISNLVDNAIKYTKENGSIKIVVDSDHQNAFITVQDTGIGIKESDQSKIYDRFYRVDKTRDRETGGTGLGLAITHAAVLLHNGSIRLISKEGEGSTFVVRIPIHFTMI